MQLVTVTGHGSKRAASGMILIKHPLKEAIVSRAFIGALVLAFWSGGGNQIYFDCIPDRRPLSVFVFVFGTVRKDDQMKGETGRRARTSVYCRACILYEGTCLDCTTAGGAVVLGC